MEPQRAGRRRPLRGPRQKMHRLDLDRLGQNEQTPLPRPLAGRRHLCTPLPDPRRRRLRQRQRLDLERDRHARPRDDQNGPQRRLGLRQVVDPAALPTTSATPTRASSSTRPSDLDHERPGRRDRGAHRPRGAPAAARRLRRHLPDQNRGRDLLRQRRRGLGPGRQRRPLRRRRAALHRVRQRVVVLVHAADDVQRSRHLRAAAARLRRRGHCGQPVRRRAGDRRRPRPESAGSARSTERCPTPTTSCRAGRPTAYGPPTGEPGSLRAYSIDSAVAGTSGSRCR